MTPINPNDPPTYFPFDALVDEQVDEIFKCLIGCLETELDGRIRKGLADTVGKWMEEWTSRGSESEGGRIEQSLRQGADNYTTLRSFSCLP